MKTKLRNTVAIAFACLTGTLSGCLKTDDVQPSVQTPVSYVSIFQASPDAPDLDILVDDKKVNNEPIKYNYYSRYVLFNPGKRNLKFNPANAANSLVNISPEFVKDKIYSVFVVNKLSNIEALVVPDNLVKPETGKAHIRFVHLSPDTPGVDVVLQGLESSQYSFSGRSFKDVTDFTVADEGRYSMKLKQAGTDTVLLTVPNTMFSGGRSYTVLLRGLTTPPSGNTNILSVQVIANE